MYFGCEKRKRDDFCFHFEGTVGPKKKKIELADQKFQLAFR
jgi:hypothetical protein